LECPSRFTSIVPAESRENTPKGTFEISMYLMFPQANHLPTLPSETTVVPAIPTPVGLDLGFPDLGQLCFPQRESPSMPEVTINEYGYFL